MTAGEISNLIDQARSRRRDDADAAKALLRRAVDLAVAAHMPRLEASARHELGRLLRAKLEDRAEALAELNRALELRIELRDVQGQIETLLELGTHAFQCSDLAHALSPLHEAERLCKIAGNRAELAAVYEILSGVYSAAEQYVDALRYSELCLDMAKELGDPGQLTHALDAVACDESELGRHAEAYRHFQESLAQSVRIENPRTRSYVEGMIHLDVARAMSMAGRWEEAIRAADRAIDIAESQRFTDVKGDALFQKARAGLALGNRENAEQLLRDAYALLQPTGNKSVLSQLERELATLYQRREDYRSAFEFLNRAMATELAMRRDAAKRSASTRASSWRTCRTS